MKAKIVLFLLIMIGASNLLSAQKLLDILDEENQNKPQYTLATFKATRISFGHSIETRKKGILEIFVANRFWNTPSLRSQSFAADRMSTRVGLEYGISDRLSLGFGGTSFDGLFDGYLKYKLVRQRSDKAGSPLSVTLFQNSSYFSEGIADPAISDDFSNRLSFTTQVLIARKFSQKFSLQIAPSFIHRGLSFSEEDPQNHIALGFGARYKLGNHVSVVSEYYTVFNPIESRDSFGPFSLGVNWEIGDLLLQFMLTNAVNMVEDAFITQTYNNFNFKNPNLNFGFNATYVIHFKSGLKKKNKKP